MSSVNTYRELKVWQKSIKFVTDIYTLTQNFPDIEKFWVDISNQKISCFNSIEYSRGICQKTSQRVY